MGRRSAGRRRAHRGAKLFAAGADIEQFVAADDTDGAAEGAADFVDGDAVRGIAGRSVGRPSHWRLLDARWIAEIPATPSAAVASWRWPPTCASLSDRFQPRQPEILLGIIFGARHCNGWPALWASRAKDLVFTGVRWTPDEALAIGWSTRWRPTTSSRTRTLALATSLAVGPRRAIALAKAAISDGIEGGLDAGLDLEEQAFVAAFATSDAAVGVGSFRRHGPGKAGFSGR
ncbi:MAG: enoyl-CoA hydratase/isomerase family protein [Microthrixaceae bacterium]